MRDRETVATSLAARVNFIVKLYGTYISLELYTTGGVRTNFVAMITDKF